jgi:hypothetical protein
MMAYGLIFYVMDIFLRWRWRAQVDIFEEWVGYRPRIALPRRYHEKMLWRRIFDTNPQFTLFLDKLAAKDFITSRVPELKIPETLWVGAALDLAPPELIQDQVVIKTNHGCSYNYFPGRENLSWDELCRLFKGWMSEPFGKELWEWGHFNIERKVFIERLVPVAAGQLLLDISIECTDGVAAYGYITVHQKTENKKLNNYAVNGEQITLFSKYIEASYRLPEGLNVKANYLAAVAFAERISQGSDYLRVDFLGNGEDLYGGEITVYPMGGRFKATPDGLTGGDTLVNAQWDLRKTWFLNNPQRGWKRWYAWALDRALRC